MNVDVKALTPKYKQTKFNSILKSLYSMTMWALSKNERMVQYKNPINAIHFVPERKGEQNTCGHLN